MKRKILIMHETVTKHDAIGNDIEVMYQIVKKECACRIFAINPLNENVEYISEEECCQWLLEENTLVIYHHSVNWELGVRLLEKAVGNIIIRYHNITPPEFFEEYNSWHYEQCSKGRILTEQMAKALKTAIWMCDSKFNTRDISKWVDEKRIVIFPPFHKLREWDNVTPDENILKTLIRSTSINLLFVGRIAPNKGIEFLLDILFVYVQEIDSNIMLRIIGKFDESLGKFNALIKNKIRKYQLEDKVEFVGEIMDATLMSYYLGSDVFVCASEHEGFCVPIIEAQHFNLPIIARNRCAVPETIGVGQLILEEDERAYAVTIQLIISDADYRKKMTENGKNNLKNRYDAEQLEKEFLKILRRY